MSHREGNREVPYIGANRSHSFLSDKGKRSLVIPSFEDIIYVRIAPSHKVAIRGAESGAQACRMEEYKRALA